MNYGNLSPRDYTRAAYHGDNPLDASLRPAVRRPGSMKAYTLPRIVCGQRVAARRPDGLERDSDDPSYASL